MVRDKFLSILWGQSHRVRTLSQYGKRHGAQMALEPVVVHKLRIHISYKHGAFMIQHRKGQGE